VDEMTRRTYADGLDRRLADLKERAKSGRYQARRAACLYPKANGQRRPLGIPTFEDKGAATGGRDAAGAGV